MSVLCNKCGKRYPSYWPVHFFCEKHRALYYLGTTIVILGIAGLCFVTRLVSSLVQSPIPIPPTVTPRLVPTSTLAPFTATPPALYSRTYADNLRQIEPDIILGQPGEFNAPHGIAVASDGSIYVADSGNHRVVHMLPDGTYLHILGRQSDQSSNEALAGTFTDPWGVTIGPDGNIYVADTWNHRIQVFSPDGIYLRMWSNWMINGGTMDSFFGPRDIRFDSTGRMYVSDTGNKRVIVFTPLGEYITEFGGKGSAQGQMNEPVGLAVDGSNTIYLADTWNKRVQSFVMAQDGFTYLPLLSWDIDGWNDYEGAIYKPYITITNQRNLIVSDPSGGLILEFTTSGEYVRGWYDASVNLGSSIFTGLAADGSGSAWITDAGNHRLMRFSTE